MRDLTTGEISQIHQWSKQFDGHKVELGGFVLNKSITIEDACAIKNSEFPAYYPQEVQGFWHTHPGEFTYTLTRADFEFAESTGWGIVLYHPKSRTWDWHDPSNQFKGLGLIKSAYFNFFHPRKGVLGCRNCGMTQVCIIDIYEADLYKYWIKCLNDILRAMEIRRNADRVAAQKFLKLGQECPDRQLKEHLIGEAIKLNKTLNPVKSHWGGF